MFRLGKHKKEPPEKPIDSGIFHHLGGHKMYPQPQWTNISLFPDRFEVEYYHLKIPYSKIKDVSNSNERKRHADWAALGLFGLLWKENRIYTIVEYNDGEDDQTIVIDFEKAINFEQAFIYKKMLECRKATESQKLEGASSSTNTPDSSNSKSPIRF